MMSGARGWRALALGLALALNGACAPERIPGPEPEPARLTGPAEVERVIFLVGDAGDARSGTYPILTRLRQDIDWWAENLEADSAVSVVFLGDIVYPLGLHDPGTAKYPADSAVVMDQVLLLGGPNARARGARGYFLAGNHDWGLESDWEGARRLAVLSNFLVMAREHTGADVVLEPPAGTGGPTVVDVGEHLRLLLLDTAWWLLYGEEEEDGLQHLGVLKAIEEAMLTAGDREIAILAHHPFRSAGPHGGNFPFWRTFGVRYFLARSGAILQDITSTPYRALERGLRDIFARLEPPLLFIGGHEHSLQVIHAVEPTDPKYIIVSGAASKNTRVSTTDGMQFGLSAPGYMRLVVGRDGSMELFVEAAPPEYLTCGGSAEARDQCIAEGVAAFETVHAQRLR